MSSVVDVKSSVRLEYIMWGKGLAGDRCGLRLAHVPVRGCREKQKWIQAKALFFTLSLNTG